MNTKRSPVWAVAGYLMLASLALMGIAYIASQAMQLLKTSDAWLPEIALTVLLILGVGGLVIVLSYMTTIFSVLNLSERTQALGLPEGSIRAVIALSLILIFSIQAIFLFGQLDITKTTDYEGITQAQLDDIPEEQIVAIRMRTIGEDTLFDVKRNIPRSQDSVDFAKQILTTISTLVVAVAGFYFGTRAVAVARGDTSQASSLVIRNINPAISERGQELAIEILGKGFEQPKTVKFVQGTKEIPCEQILSNETKITGKIKFGSEDSGIWDLIVINQDGSEDRLPNAFTLTEPE